MNENKRLKILFLPAWYPSEKNPVNGIFIREHAKAVNLYNDVVVLYSEGPDKNLRKLWDVISDKEEEGIRTVRIKYRKSPVPKTTYFIYLQSIKLAFSKFLEEGYKPDIIHAHVYSAGVPAVLLGRKYNVPVIITEHYTNFANHSLTLAERIKAKFSMERAEIVLPVSNDLKNAITNFYKIKANTVVIPNVVNIDKYSVSINNEGFNDNSKKNILTVCVLSKRKGVDYLLQAIARLSQIRKDFILNIVGEGEYKRNLERLAKNLGLNDIVRFWGYQENILDFYKKSNFFVLVSFYENFGVVYIEAMACGKPVIGTNVGGPREFINKKTGILVEPGDIEELEDAINYMLDHYSEYSSKEISQYVKDNFSYKVVGKKLDEIYRDVLT